MGIFQKLSLLLRSNINDAIAKAENPDKMLTQIIADMREQLSRAKQEVAVAIADERKLRAQCDEEHKQAQEWEHRAMLAVREGRDDLAKQALLRQQEHAERALAMEETWGRQSAETEKLKGSLRQLNDKIEEAKRKKNLLVAKQKRAQAQRRIHETMAGLSDRSAFEAFERVAERIEDSERQLAASEEVAGELAGDTVEKEFARLEVGESVENRLLSLKKEMGLLPGGPTEEPRRLGAGGAGAEVAAGDEGAKGGRATEAELEEEA